MSGFLLSACAGRTRMEEAPNPYLGASADELQNGRTPAPPPPPSGPRRLSRRELAQVPTSVPDATPGGVYYRVASGDTLHSISKRSGVPVDTIRCANGIRGNTICPGKYLWLPGGRPIDCACSTTPSGTVVCETHKPTYRPRGGYKVVARSDWGARPMRSNYDPMHGIRRITIHHTDEIRGVRARGDREIVYAIQRYHQDSMGWADIGYHYLIGTDGLIYEGRVASAQGAHSGGANNIENLGIAMVGNFTGKLPNQSQMNALEAFLADQRAANRVAASQVHGHRDFGSTECPGTTLYSWLQNYKRA